METSTKRKCKRCGEEKEHIFVGRHESKSKKFVDEQGGYWNGRICSVCQKKQVKEMMAKLRAERKAKKLETP